jgi:hypothetical protein
MERIILRVFLYLILAANSLRWYVGEHDRFLIQPHEWVGITLCALACSAWRGPAGAEGRAAPGLAEPERPTRAGAGTGPGDPGKLDRALETAIDAAMGGRRVAARKGGKS